MTSMKSRTPPFPTVKVLLILTLVLLIVVTALAAGPSVERWFTTPAGGYMDGEGLNILSAVAEPASGSVSNGLTLCSGYLCGPGATAVDQKFVYLPTIFRDACGGFNKSFEEEPNNSPGTANGPLCFGKLYLGSPDDNQPGVEYDYFYFDLPAGSAVRVTVSNFLAEAQVFLTKESSGADAGWVYNQPSGTYQIDYGGALGAGRYLVWLFAPPNHPVGHGNYSLKVELN